MPWRAAFAGKAAVGLATAAWASFTFLFSALDAGTLTALGVAAISVLTALVGGVTFAYGNAVNRVRRERQQNDLDALRAQAQVARDLGLRVDQMMAWQQETLRRTNDANAKLHQLSADSAVKGLVADEHTEQLAEANARLDKANARLDEANTRLRHLEAALEDERHEKARLLAQIEATQARVDSNSRALAGMADAAPAPAPPPGPADGGPTP